MRGRLEKKLRINKKDYEGKDLGKHEIPVYNSPFFSTIPVRAGHAISRFFEEFQRTKNPSIALGILFFYDNCIV